MYKHNSLLLQVNIQDPAGEGALHTAALRGDIAMVTALLKQGADINLQDKEGVAPLHMVCISWPIQLIE